MMSHILIYFWTILLLGLDEILKCWERSVSYLGFGGTKDAIIVWRFVVYFIWGIWIEHNTMLFRNNYYFSLYCKLWMLFRGTFASNLCTDWSVALFYLVSTFYKMVVLLIPLGLSSLISFIKISSLSKKQRIF